ncbi:hypothetical protein [Clostridium botulinum]|uniref:hypothetical protein n=1 Tax=Clostridium botulinum TaxID=1491 RepID=UPI00249189E9|nr:hypothetical protein [Clostridium botulinum]BDB00796.1 hypothetical protein CBOS2020_08700 [Clostridium botulinum]
MIKDGRINNIDIKVSKESENRAFRIFDTILKFVEDLGYKINRCVLNYETKLMV